MSSEESGLQGVRLALDSSRCHLGTVEQNGPPISQTSQIYLLNDTAHLYTEFLNHIVLLLLVQPLAV